MSDRFAGEIAGIELGEGCLDVFDIEDDNRRNPLVGADLEDRERFGEEGFDPSSPRE